MLLRVKGENDWFVYHEGVDLLYERAGYPHDAIMQGKGSLFYWQCKPCNLISRVGSYKFRLDHDKGEATSVPHCSKCKRPVRPNVNLRNDMDWLETEAQRQNENFEKWFTPRDKRSLTVLEIGAGPVQPLSRSIGESLLKDDKYRTALIRINPVSERDS